MSSLFLALMCCGDALSALDQHPGSDKKRTTTQSLGRLALQLAILSVASAVTAFVLAPFSGGASAALFIVTGVAAIGALCSGAVCCGLKLRNYFRNKKNAQADSTRPSERLESVEFSPSEKMDALMETIKGDMLKEVPDDREAGSRKNILHLIQELSINNTNRNMDLGSEGNALIKDILAKPERLKDFEDLMKFEYLNKTPQQRESGIKQRQGKYEEINEKYRDLYKIIDNPQVAELLKNEFAKYEQQITEIQRGQKNNSKMR